MLSEFTSRLHTNYAPSDGEILQIKQLLIKPQAELLTLDEEIQRVQGLLNDLLLKRDTLQETLQAHEALISIPRRLPQDILQEIFLRCLPTDTNAVMNCKEAPLLLGRICSNWRTIVYATPQLWTSIHIPMFDSESLGMPLDLNIDYRTYQELSKRIAFSRTQAVRDWLNRAGSCPLSISYYGIPGVPLWNSNGYEILPDCIMEILSTFSRQWRDMYFSIPAQSSQGLLHRLATDDVPILRSLSVIATSSFTNQTLLNMSITPVIPSDIQSLSLLPIPNMAIFKYLAETCWTQITRLSLDCDIPEISTSLKLSTTLSVLRHCPQITHFWWVIQYASEPDEHSTLEGPPVTLTHLRSMIIKTAVSIQEFLDCLILPSLSSLAIQLIQLPMENNGLPLSINPFISHIGEQITSLTIDCSTENPQEYLRRCMSHMPLVKKVRIVEYEWFTMPLQQFARRHITDGIYLLDDEILKMLTPSKDLPAVSVWPDLETLECDVNVVVSMERILEFLEARNGKTDVGIAQIKRAKLTLYCLVPQIMVEGDDARVCESRIAKLREDGVELDIYWVKIGEIRNLSAWRGITTTRHQEW